MQAAVTPWVFAVGDGSLLTFSFPWYLDDASELEVYLAGVHTTAYTLSGLHSPTGGTITFYVPPANGQILFLRRVTPQTQDTDYVPNDPFDAAAHEAALDKLTREVQDLTEALSRRPALLTTIDNAHRGLLWPSPLPGGVIGWNADASALMLYFQDVAHFVAGETRGKSTALLTAAPGSAAPLVAPGLVPQGARCMAVVLRHLVPWNTAGGLTGLDLGGMGLQDGWGRDLPLTTPFTSDLRHVRRGDEPIAQVAEAVTLTPKGGPWGALGQTRVTAHWKMYSAD